MKKLHVNICKFQFLLCQPPKLRTSCLVCMEHLRSLILELKSISDSLSSFSHLVIYGIDLPADEALAQCHGVVQAWGRRRLRASGLCCAVFGKLWSESLPVCGLLSISFCEFSLIAVSKNI